MADENYKRKLTAILSADVAGYSRLMGEDEAATVSTLKSYRKLIAEKIRTLNGRILDSPGDNILAEFGSIVDAVTCAVDIQKKLEEKNNVLPDNRKMIFRIGVNLGDVIQDGEKIYGDGVNIAARIESLAKPGEVVISGTAFDNVRNKLQFGFEFKGEHQVKNIAQPVRVYRVLTDPADSGKLIGELEGDRNIVPKTVLAMAVVIFIVGATFFYFANKPSEEITTVKQSTPVKVEKPPIAVLPFTNMSDDPQQEYFSDGITEDLITDLSKIAGLFVIARNSTFTYKNKAVKVQQVAKDLGVRYVLEGSVRKGGEKVRINAQLVDAITGHHLWAERFDSVLSDIFALQDSITRKIVAALALKLTLEEEKGLSFRYTSNVEAYDAYLKGRKQYNLGTRDGLVMAVEFFEKAIELDPNYSAAHAGLAITYRKSMERAMYKELGWKDVRAREKKHLQQAMKNPTPYAHYAVAKTRLYQRRFDEAIAEAENAIALDPNYSDGYVMMGYVLIYAGRSTEAIENLKMAMRLDPHNPATCLYLLGLGYYFLEKYEEGTNALNKSIKLGGRFGPWPLAISYAQMDRGQKAANILSEYFDKRKWNLVFIEHTFKYWPFKEQKDLDHWAEGLRKSGLMRPWNPVYRREYEKAIADAEQNIAARPNDAHSQYTMGETLVYTGRSAEAIDYLEKAIDLNPNYPGYYMYTLGLAQFCTKKYEEAATSLEQCLIKRKMHLRPPMWLLAATYAHLGKQQDAEEVLKKYVEKNGFNDYTVERVLKYYLHALKDPMDTERFAQGLHRAGLPMK